MDEDLSQETESHGHRPTCWRRTIAILRRTIGSDSIQRDKLSVRGGSLLRARQTIGDAANYRPDGELSVPNDDMIGHSRAGVKNNWHTANSGTLPIRHPYPIVTVPQKTAIPTDKQARALRIIALYQAENGRSPSREELAIKLALGGKTNPSFLVRPLREKGYLEAARRTHRAYALTQKGREWIQADLAQQVATGEKLTAPQ